MPQPQPPPPTSAVTAPPSAILLRVSHHLLAQHLWRQPPTTPRATVFYAVSSPSITLPPPLRAPRNSSDNQPIHHTKPHRLRSRVVGTTTALLKLEQLMKLSLDHQWPPLVSLNSASNSLTSAPLTHPCLCFSKSRFSLAKTLPKL
ncbi:hypothetical protein DEO72_LG1g2651 [Vigna unguiculata]|uniref:Uncharacterized protein n=1 Tax=Vigna unguiculata TaxID=3917 RepID=A0A4D6KYN9_VIGUN|nr:hypothetical protein DEO72_LG1g2651 [Vigna unguiculata]